ncbi:hypothetical protein [Bradyrhizobium cenepequi]
MDKLAHFIETENIAYFTALLETETEPHKRQQLMRLLAAERAKRAARLDIAPSSRP